MRELTVDAEAKRSYKQNLQLEAEDNGLLSRLGGNVAHRGLPVCCQQTSACPFHIQNPVSTSIGMATTGQGDPPAATLSNLNEPSFR